MGKLKGKEITPEWAVRFQNLEDGTIAPAGEVEQQTLRKPTLEEAMGALGLLKEAPAPADTPHEPVSMLQLAVDGELVPENPKDRIGSKKAPLHLVPSTAIIHEAMAMANGAEKYGAFNWRTKRVIASIYIAAALRHIYAWLDGEAEAADSGVHHLGHARACLGILLDAEATASLEDDRVMGAAPALLKRFDRSGS